MGALWIIARREIWSYLTSPVAYVVFGFFFAAIAFLFCGVAKLASDRTLQLVQYEGVVPGFNVVEVILRPMFHNMGLVLVFVVPLLTMRLFAEERRQRTYDLLFSAPINIVTIVGGKFLAAVVIYTGLLALTLLLPAVLVQYATFDWAPVAAAYVGLWLLGLLFIAVGLFASALTEYQIVAAFIGIGILLLMWILGQITPDAEMTTLSAIERRVALSVHFDAFIQGLISTTSIGFFVGFAALWLTVAYRVVETNRWR